MKLFLLKPGYVLSRTDNDTHYIGERQLCRLYDVKRDECVIAGTSGHAPGLSRDIENALMKLHPRYDGNYVPISQDDREAQVIKMEAAFAAKAKREQEAKWVGIPVKDGAGNIVGRVIEAKLVYSPDSAQITCEVEPSFVRYLTSSMNGEFSVGD